MREKAEMLSPVTFSPPRAWTPDRTPEWLVRHAPARIEPRRGDAS
jgi:hypothetical protein